jgi:hypothetical protein
LSEGLNRPAVRFGQAPGLTQARYRGQFRVHDDALQTHPDVDEGAGREVGDAFAPTRRRAPVPIEADGPPPVSQSVKAAPGNVRLGNAG